MLDLIQTSYLKKLITTQLRKRFYSSRFRNAAFTLARVGVGKYKCAGCGKIITREECKIDHKEAVIDPKVGFVNWDIYIQRLFCDPKNLQVLCKICHDKKTLEEKQLRKVYKTGVSSVASRQLMSLRRKGTLSKKQAIHLDQMQQDRKKKIKNEEK